MVGCEDVWVDEWRDGCGFLLRRMRNWVFWKRKWIHERIRRVSQSIDENSMARVKEWGIGKSQDKECVLREERVRGGERVS